ncbi:MAG: hypothetical protein QGI31_07815, partial [Dehalococcoidia bacterium]|nr:hypothetical protein [Dehalococcoidia bacterium]
TCQSQHPDTHLPICHSTWRVSAVAISWFIGHWDSIWLSGWLSNAKKPRISLGLLLVRLQYGGDGRIRTAE